MSEITQEPEKRTTPVYILDPHANRTKEQDIDLSHTTGKMPTWQTVRESVSTRSGWFGDYDYGFLCMPTLPGFTSHRVPPFFGLKDRLPLVLAIIMGFQHSLAMIAGVVTPAIIMSGSGNTGLNLSPADRTQMVSTSLITSGLLSLIQITRFRVANTPYFLGTGLLSVVGTSFIYLPVLQSSVSNMYASGVCKSSVDPTTGTQTFEPCPDAWGAYLGTCMVCALLPIILSFVPPRALKRIFPPIVTGVTVMLIGVNLVTSGMQQWGGGSGPCLSRPTTGPFVNCPAVGAPNAAPWGSAQWIGLGFLVFSTIMVVEFFGSPFMKNAQVVIGLIVGMIVAVVCGYTTRESLDAAPVITFLWVKTYKLSIYPPAIIPLLITYVLAMVESIGDITASCEVSQLSVEGREFESRLQGGIFADGVAGLLAPLMTNSPMSCYAQNNGIISLTRCANTMAGYMCCVFLILMGVFSKFGALFLMLPDSVLGGMTTFLFASVVVSGIRILSFLPWTRRERFIVAASLSLGLGTALVPGVLTHMIDYKGSSAFLSSLITSVNIILDTGFALGAIVSCLLNALLPEHRVVQLEADDVIDRHGPMAATDTDRLAVEEEGHYVDEHGEIEHMKTVESRSSIHNGSIHSKKN
ncbi:purine permease [Linnemannia elongata]|nr:purine permease [Linnemannia elongata]